MRRQLVLASLMFVAWLGLAVAQPPDLPPAKVPPPVKAGEAPKKDDSTPLPAKPVVPEGPPEFEARFSDDSLVKVSAVDPSVSVITKYGKLDIPLADIVRLDVGFRYPPGVEAQVAAAIAALGSPAFRDREDAEKAILKLGEVTIPALRRALKSPDPETARRSEALFKKITEKLPPEKIDLKDYDVVETAEVLIRGKVDQVGVKVRSKLFGEQMLALTDLRSLRTVATANNEFTVDASKHARPNQPLWFDTGIDVSSDLALEIIGNGTVDLGPQQPGQYVATPIGNANNGFGAMIATPNGRQYRYNPGALVGRIGADGVPFLVGSLFKAARAPSSGRLFLTIAPSAWGGESTGNYKVKVKSGGG